MARSTQAAKQGVRRKKQGAGSGGNALLQRAYGLHRQGEIAAAHKAYEAFLSRFPRHGEAMGNFGLLLHSQGQIERAVTLYQQAIELAPRQDHLFYHLGNGLCQLGRPQEAIAAYEQARAPDQNQPDLLVALALAHGDAGHLAEAQGCFETILQLNPDHSQASYHLGLLFFQQEQFAEAAACFTTVLAVEPDYVDACFNLGLCHKALGQSGPALESLQRAARLAPDDADILYNIGVLHKEQGEMAAAESTFLQALEVEPAYGICLTDLAILYHSANRLDEAKAMYERALESGYQAESALHMLAALNGETTDVTPLQHVRDLFNNYARSFDTSLEDDLHYSVPAQLADSFQQFSQKGEFSAGLDLGCGTGLAGLAFRGRVRHFTGVDVSESMLAMAAAKGLYDELHCTGIIDFLHGRQSCYDLALATDVFVYLGALETFFTGMERTLRPGGFLLFSVESCDHHYCLRQSGRYAHSPAYIARQARRFHFTIVQQQPTGIRKERGEWIPGELYILQRH